MTLIYISNVPSHISNLIPHTSSLMLRFIFIFGLLLNSLAVLAQERVIKYDTSTVSVRNFNSPAIEKYKADPAFQYDAVIATPKSWWTRFWDKFWEAIRNVFETESGQLASRTIFIILSIVILVIAGIILGGMRNAGMFGKKNTEDAFAYSVTEDNIHAINFNDAIEQAIDNRNFRLAVRLLYLQTLKNLTDEGLINWQPDKTNITYVNELTGNQYQQDFRNLTLQFENNWYGDLPIELTEFLAVRDQFSLFNQKLS